MTTTPTPTPTSSELDLQLVAAIYQIPAEQAAAVALRTQALLAAWQLGREGGGIETLVPLLHAPAVAVVPAQANGEPTTEKIQAMLAGALAEGKLTAPATAAAIATALGIPQLSRRVAQALPSAGWTHGTQVAGVMRWVPPAR